MPRYAAALAVLIASLAAAPGAQAGFVATNDEVVAIPSNSSGGEIGIDGKGNALIAWDQNSPANEVKARRFAATGALGPLLDLNPGQVGRDPVVAMTASGRAFVAWRAPTAGPSVSGVQGRWVGVDGSLGPIAILATGKAGELEAAGLQVTVDPAGVVTATWKNETGGGGGELMLRRVQPDGTVGTLVPDVTGGKPVETKIAALPNGSTLIAWRGTYIEKTVVGPDLTLGTPQQISGDNLGAEVELAVDSQGHALVTWRRDFEETFGVRGRLLDPAGNPLGEDLIFDASLPGILDNRPLAVDSLDDFLVTWVRPDGDGDNVVYARHFNGLLGQVGPIETVSDENQGSAISQATIDDFGGGAVAWAEFKGMTGTIPFGRTINSLGAPTGPIQELFAPRASLSRSASAPAAGVAMFLLESFSGEVRTVHVRRYLEPPSCVNSTADAVQGKPTDLPLACAGPAIEAAKVIEPPKHGSLGSFKPGPSLEYVAAPGFVGTDSFTYSALNDVGGSNVARVEIKVRQAGPTIERFRFVKGPKRRYSFVLQISAPARATVVVERAARGLRKGKRCAKPKKGESGKRCKRYVKLGKVGAKSPGKKLTLQVPKKLAKRLTAGGRFRATALATDLAGGKSKPKAIAFRIQAKKKATAAPGA